MWWCNILKDNEGIISYLLWFDTITEGSFLLTYNIVFPKRENPEPVLTVKTIEWGKIIDFFGLNIEANPSRVGGETYIFSILGLHQALYLDSSVYQSTSWTKS